MPQTSLSSKQVADAIETQEFRSLPAEHQKKWLLTNSPEFSKLDEVNQNLYVSRLHFPKPTKTVQPEDVAENDPARKLAPAYRGMMGVGRALRAPVYDVPAGLYHAAVDPLSEQEKADGKTSRGIATTADRVVTAPMREERKKGREAQTHSERFGHTAAGYIPLIGPWAANLGERAGSGDVTGAIAEGATSWMLPKIMSKGLKVTSAGMSKYQMSKYRPQVLTIEGVEIPVLADEAGTKGATKTAEVKASGVGREKFIEVQKQQQAAVKEIIRRVAQKTSRFVGPMTESPSGAVGQAADALHAQAKPLYAALDAAVSHVPNIFLNELDGVMEKAISKVREFGGVIEEPRELKSGNVEYPKQPLSGYMDVRSRLLKIGRETKDNSLRSAVWDNVNAMDAEIEKALTKTRIPGLVDNWKSANALWRRGYALQRVADSFARAERGTPVEAQSSGIAAREPRLSAATLVNELNKLDAKGELSRAFGDGAQGQKHIASIRQIADILDRAQRSKIGSGKPVEGVHVIARIKRLGAKILAKAMTTPQGSTAVLNYLQAITDSQAFTWSSRIMSATVGPVQPPPGASNQPE